jgi:hypothetical protein
MFIIAIEALVSMRLSCDGKKRMKREPTRSRRYTVLQFALWPASKRLVLVGLSTDTFCPIKAEKWVNYDW